MKQYFTGLQELNNWNEIQIKFGEIINVKGTVPVSVINRAFADDRFAFYLVLTKDSPDLQKQLFEDSKNREFEEKKFEEIFSNKKILAKASGALFKWAKAGFTQVDDATFERRMAACKSCPHLKQPPAKTVYKISKLTGGDQSVCGLCSCVVSRKAKLPTESCPAIHPENSSLNRWGEPLKTS